MTQVAINGPARRWQSTLPITTVSGTPQYTIPAGSTLLQFTSYGSLLAGLNPNLTDETGTVKSVNSQMVDFGFLESQLRLLTRSLRLAELGDPPDLILARWGPNNGYPYATPTGMNTGQSMGALRWMPAVNAFGATPDVTPGGSLQVDAATISVRTVEVPRDTTGTGVYAVGSNMSISVAPVGGTAVEVMRLLSTGHFWLGTQTIAAASDTALLTLFTEAIGTKGLIVRGFAGQTADLFDVQDSGGTSYLRVAANKTITLYDGSKINAGTTTGLMVANLGGAAGQKLGFFGVTPVVQPLLATGAAHTVDDVITTLQTLGLCRQS